MNLKYLSRIFYIAILALIIVGSALVLSASSAYSALRFHDNLYRLFSAHIIRVVIAIFSLVLFSVIPYELYRVYSKKIIIGVAGLLVLTLFIAPNVKGAGRWINLGLFSFQPSEIAKFFLIVHLAYLIEAKGDELQDYKNGFKYPLVWIIIIAGLIFVQPNVSTSLVVSTIAFTLLFIGGAKISHIVSTVGLAGIAAFCFMMMFHHSRQRILTFFHSFGSGSEINLQVAQAKIALGSGGFLGLGLGQSRQSNLFLPEAYGDFIFSIMGEELGFLGVVVILLIYLVIFFAGIIIAKNAKDKFGQLLAFGISFTIIISAFINAAVVTGIFPTTGIPLPFISYGGTSIIFMCGAAGVIVNIAVKSHKYKLKTSQASESVSK
ncbi:MAG: cell division protein FtsW [Ignavibacteria bacterium]|jgi:cell division protein FtsW|nr:cell division protein FtsW [Ignavibacteria bacterium]MCU7503154.1 cell division protein FtsW [Ignavibacteria bacterium]MCU7518032.1 cell division protein FtsW [Ignavibacteria bacterium]